jgi:hypothetical protein
MAPPPPIPWTKRPITNSTRLMEPLLIPVPIVVSTTAIVHTAPWLKTSHIIVKKIWLAALSIR